MRKINLAVFASGRGSNFKAIIEAIDSGIIKDTDVSILISDNKTANALKIARDYNIPAVSVEKNLFDTKESYDSFILNILQAHNIDMVILAGYLKILSPVLISKYQDKILNIHPSLLPQFAGLYGLNVHKEVLKSNIKVSGCTVHLVTEEIDSGRILAQKTVEVMSNDTPESLSQRILEQEYILYPQVIEVYKHEIFKLD